MVLTCPSCHHPIEVSGIPAAGEIRCGNCGGLVPTAAPADVPALGAALSSSPFPPPRNAAAVGSLVCGLLFFIPLLTQALGLLLAVIALVRSAVAGRRPHPAAWAGLLLCLALGIGWGALLVSIFAGTRTVAVSTTPYGSISYGPSTPYGAGDDPSAGCGEQFSSAMERIGAALTAYQRDMSTWPTGLDELVPTYLAGSVADAVDPERASGPKRLVTMVPGVAPHTDPPDRVVAYSERCERDITGQRLPRPTRWVLRLNGTAEPLDAARVEALLGLSSPADNNGGTGESPSGSPTSTSQPAPPIPGETG